MLHRITCKSSSDRPVASRAIKFEVGGTDACHLLGCQLWNPSRDVVCNGKTGSLLGDGNTIFIFENILMNGRLAVIRINVVNDSAIRLSRFDEGELIDPERPRRIVVRGPVSGIKRGTREN